jgi:DNA (cytosine-5)-methyltransferase 1
VKIGSLCTGYGGLDLAVEEIFEARTVWVSEIDKNASVVAEARFGVPNLGDLKEIDWNNVERPDILTAGYPCQPFSQAGKRQGEEDPRHIWPWIIEGVRRLRPQYVILENVRGHLSKGFGTVIGDLADARYDAQWACVRASEVGAPHRRERVFIVAHRHGELFDGSRDLGQGGHGRLAGSASSDQGREEERERDGDASGGRRPVAADTDRSGSQGREVLSERGGEQLAGPYGLAVPSLADARDNGLLGHPEQHSEAHSGLEGEHRGHPDGRPVEDAGRPDMGKYEPAVQQWERMTRPAPHPQDEKGRLNPLFVEWMMGLPAGWVTDLIPARAAALKILGNGVVPRQAEYAVRGLL